jgi:hypothetical protein
MGYSRIYFGKRRGFEMRKLKTAEQVAEVLRDYVCPITEGRFFCSMYDAMTRALGRRGYTADPVLWRQVKRLVKVKKKSR